MNHLRRYFLIISLIITFLGGCTLPTYKYNILYGNVEKFKSIMAKTSSKIKVIPFASKKGDHKSIMCRLSVPIAPPGGKTFESYITDAFITELKVSGLYSSDGDIVINGEFEEISFSSVSDYWSFRLKISSEGKEQFIVESKYEYPSQIFAPGSVACRDAAKEFSNAVQGLIRDIANDPKFADMLHSR